MLWQHNANPKCENRAERLVLFSCSHISICKQTLNLITQVAPVAFNSVAAIICVARMYGLLHITTVANEFLPAKWKVSQRIIV